ncbi:MAG: antibiotic biosynthesis monooxygenase [Clostridiales bacterium]|nr:antibiotic biosynthesis monooxygenase [Clostridiales bacterium]
MERHSEFGKFTAKAGHGRELLNILLEAAEEMKKVPDCRCYIVGMDKEEPDSVYVFEVWENEEAHQASLSLDSVKNMIKNAMPIIDGMINFPDMVIYGGKAGL